MAYNDSRHKNSLTIFILVKIRKRKAQLLLMIRHVFDEFWQINFLVLITVRSWQNALFKIYQFKLKACGVVFIYFYS